MPEDWAEGGSPPGVRTIGDPLLREAAPSVPGIDLGVRQVLDTLTHSLRALGGAGLAAPQLGIPSALAVVEVRRTELFPHRPESGSICLVNPRVADQSGPDEEDWEGCFSVPGLVGRVRRPGRISVEHLSLDGGTVVSPFEGYLARVVQHEIDHLEGVLYLDRVTDTRTLSTLGHYRRTLAH